MIAQIKINASIRITIVLLFIPLTSFICNDKFKEINFNLDLANQLIENIDSISSTILLTNVIIKDDIDYVTLNHDSKTITYRLIPYDTDSLKADKRTLTFEEFNKIYHLDNMYDTIRLKLIELEIQQLYRYEESISFFSFIRDRYMYGFIYTKNREPWMKNKRFRKEKQYIRRINDNWILIISYISI